jgi:DNA-binding transcriptional ArsR family regulator
VVDGARAAGLRARVDGSVDRVFAALGDPGRRELVRAISERGSATATELAADLPVTRQAVAKQLAGLAEAGLVVAERRGRETRYALTPAPLAEAAAWMADVGAAWDARLAGLHRHLGSRAGDRR